MSYIGSWKIDDLLTFTVVTHRVDTGVATDADSVPTYRVYEDETGTPIVTGSMALLDSSNTAGFYSEQITLSAANGFEKGKSYNIYITATVNGIAGATTRNLQIEAEVDANTVSPTTVNVDVIKISGDTTAADNLETMLDGTGGQVLTLKQLAITNSAGDAILAQSTGGNGSGLHVIGTGTGDGIRAAGGASGLAASGGSENGITAIGPNGKAGIYAVGGGLSGGTGDGMLLIGGSEDQTGNGVGLDALGAGADGPGIYATNNGAAAGAAFVGGPTNGNGLEAYSLGAGKSISADMDIAVSDGNLTLAAIAAAVWALVIETGYTAKNSMRLMLAALAGKLSGAATTTVVIRDVNDAKNRITATVDADGNRTSVSHDVS